MKHSLFTKIAFNAVVLAAFTALTASADPVAKIGDTEYETLAAAIDAAKSGATVQLIADTKENVTIAKKLTLDLNGFTLNGGTEKGKAALTVTASVTVKDFSEAQTGTIKREDTAENSGVTSHYVIDVQGNGWLIFESGKVINNSGNADRSNGASLVRVGNDSVAKYPGLNIKGGTFTQDNYIVIKVDRGYLYLNDGTVTSANSYAIENWHQAFIKDGTVNGNVASWTYSGGANSSLTISGGTINGDVTAVNYGDAGNRVAKVKISGGTVNGELDTRRYDTATGELTSIEETAKASIEVTGGTFSKDPSKYVVEDSAITTNEDGSYGVAKAYLAKVGESSYYTMDEAFKAQTDSGDAIVLLRDYTTYTIFNSGSINRTVDLNGKTWTYTGTDSTCAAFEINYSDVTLTVKNGKVVSNSMLGLIPSAMSGTITYDNAGLVFDEVEATVNGHSGIETNGGNTNDAVTLKDSTLNVPNGYGIYFPSSGTVTIENSTINAKTMGVQVCSGSLNISENSAIMVTGDAVPKTENDGAIEDGAAVSIVNRPGYKGLGTVSISGGTFTAKSGNQAVKAYTWENLKESTFDNANGTVAISGGTFSTAIDEKYCALDCIPTVNGDGTYGVKEGKYVAAIGEAKYETVADAIAAAKDGETVTLLADSNGDGIVVKGNSFPTGLTVDFAGHTYTVGGLLVGSAATKSNGFQLLAGNKIAFKNGTILGETATAGEGTDWTGAPAILIQNYCDLTLEKMTVKGGAETCYTLSNNNGDVVIADSTIVAGQAKGTKYSPVAFDVCRYASYPSVRVTVKGESVIEGNVEVSGTIGEGESRQLDIEDGTFTGVFKVATKPANIAISGGTFSTAIDPSYCAEGFIPTANEDGTYGVKEVKYVAAIGDTKYESFAAAVAAVQDGETITLLADTLSVDASKTAEADRVTIAANVTLELNGHTLTTPYELEPSNNWATFYIKGGCLTVNDSVGNGGIKSGDADHLGTYLFHLQGGDLVVESGNFFGGCTIANVERGTATINGGTFAVYHDKDTEDSRYLLNCIDASYKDGTAHIVVNGGIFTDYDPRNNAAEGESTNFVAPGVGVDANEDGTFTAKANMSAQIIDALGNSVKAYATLAEAVAAAQDGETVRLLADATEDVAIAKSITLDLNGKTLTNTNVGKATVSIAGGAVATVKNGTIIGGTSWYTIEVTKNSAASLTLEDVTATAGNTGSSMIDNWGTLTINSGTYTGGLDVVKSEEGSTLTINGGTFTLAYAEKWKFNAVILNYGDATISGGEFIQNSNISMCYPQVVMTGVVDGYTSITRVTGGTFTNNSKNSRAQIFWSYSPLAVGENFEVSGGTFNKSISDDYCVDGIIPTKNADGTYGVKDGSYVAAVGSKKYETLADAIRLAAKGKTITLLTDVKEDISITKNLTLDLNGKTLTNTDAGKATVTIAASVTATVVKNGTIVGGTSYYTIQNLGTATFENVTATAGNVGSSMFDNAGMLTINSGSYTGGMDTIKNEANATLVITGGAFENSYGENNAHTGVIYNLGSVEILDGEFVQKATTPAWAYPHVIMTAYEGSKPRTVIKGGTFTSTLKNWKGTILNHDGADSAGCTFVSGGTFNMKVDESYCAAGYVPAENSDGTYGVTLLAVVFVNGEAKTLDETAQKALDEVKSAASGATVQYEVVNAATSEKVTAEDVDDRTLDFAKLPNGTYTLRAKMTQDGTTETKEIVKVGVVQVAKNALTILAVPFADIDGKPVTVATLFNAAAADLTDGDTLNVYDSAKQEYVSFAYENGAWSDATHATDAKVDPKSFELARGMAVRLDSKNAAEKKIALVGTLPTDAAEEVATTIPAGKVGLAVNVTTADKKVSAITTTGTTDVNLFVPTADGNVQYVRQADGWKKGVRVKLSDTAGYWKSEPVTDSDTIPAGTGYWVSNLQKTDEAVK